MNTKDDREDEITLELLEAIGRDSNVSQRHLARQLGVALGLANSYLKRCMRKGFVKIKEAPANRYLYYLTPKGFAEKSQLTTRYLASSFSFYRKASNSCRGVFQRCAANGWNRVMLCGLSDLAEIAALRAMESNIEVVGIFDPDSEYTQFLSKPVWREFDAAGEVDAFVITELNAPSARYDQLTRLVDKELVLVPDILRLE